MNNIFHNNNLKDIEAQIWELLVQSSNSANTPFHEGVIATVNGNIPEQRTVILRNIDVFTKTLSFNTDIRSMKIEQLQVNNSVSWLFYDKILKVQLRMYAKAVVHRNNAVAKLAWEKSRLSSRMCYTTIQKPGSFIDTPELVEINQLSVNDELLDFARENFAVIETQVYAVDFVFLNRNGNKRAYFDYQSHNFQWRQV